MWTANIKGQNRYGGESHKYNKMRWRNKEIAQFINKVSTEKTCLTYGWSSDDNRVPAIDTQLRLTAFVLLLGRI
jgi:hypothetical protein